MLKPHFQQSTKTLVPSSTKPFISREILALFPTNILNNNLRINQKKKNKNFRVHNYSKANSTKAVLSSTEKSTSVKAVVIVQKAVNLSLSRGLDDIGDLLGKSLLLWIVAADLDPKTGIEKPSIKTFAHRGRDVDGDTHYEADFVIPEDFGDVGAILVENEHHKEMFVKNIVIDGFPNGKVDITCNSWVHSKFDNPDKRIFFTNKSYLPSQTPSGVKRLREEELVTIRGNGFGERKKFERIYDYDVYNDIGDPDGNGGDGKRPVLGGKKFSYPRRCRTGRPRSQKDPLSESRSTFVYVPRDETFSEAVKQKKLFILDYHDLLLPYVNKVNELKGTVLYGSRTLFLLTSDGTLRPLAIELTRPPVDDKPQWKQVYCPSTWNATGAWLWKLAKAHVLSHDSGYHQLVSHWLRTHCCTEPYIIAANRQLSAMHPIYRLLHPHFRYTMEINALAREALINANGIIESSFFPGKYAVELSSVAYDLEWRFDHEALPQNLISRGLAEEDPNAPHGLKLTIQDYPFANDGLVLWDTLKQWVTAYVNHYYPQEDLIESDKEIQAWWTEIKNVGHGDKRNEAWWPQLETPNDLIGIITTIIWVTSGHHAAVNFGQYSYAGYFPNRPTIARSKMPTEDPTNEEWEHFLKKPEEALLKCFPSQIQATKVMAILDVLSNHSPDEEYLGEKIEPHWAEEPVIKAAFEVFSGKLKELEGIIDARNADSKLMNRNGAGVVPYELLKPFSEPGVTGKGVPYSISI
ncbi:hypothetical protein HAX54_003475 [Datura stramonium]|uniref:Lipoxygenase n=1 Tax=Datura stramonium TaxID=4076 RepID=A0ABS8T649_DATST|nr:hypothetical protein [Datura stramonium]